MKIAIHIVIILACFFGVSLPIEAKPVDKKGTRAIAKPGYQSIPEAKFQEIFRDYLSKRLGKEKSDILVSRMKAVGNKPVPAGRISFNVFQKEKGRLEGHVRLVAMVGVNGVVKNKVKLSGWADVFESVACASRQLKKGEIITKDDIYLARKNISHLSSKILTDPGKVVGLRVKHNIKEDTPLKEWMLERAPIVKRGDMVTILAESGALRVTVPGKVLEKGYLGELIRVQNAMSKRQIHARVINNSTVVVDF